jgi:hypothetical protein
MALLGRAFSGWLKRRYGDLWLLKLQEVAKNFCAV